MLQHSENPTPQVYTPVARLSDRPGWAIVWETESSPPCWRVLRRARGAESIQLQHWDDIAGAASFRSFKRGSRSSQHLGRTDPVLTRSPFSTAGACVPPRILAAETSPSPSCTGIWTWCQDARFLPTSSKCKRRPATQGLITFSRSSLGMRAENSICG